MSLSQPSRHRAGAFFIALAIAGALLSTPGSARSAPQGKARAANAFGFSAAEFRSSKPIGVLVQFDSPPAARAELNAKSRGITWNRSQREAAKGAVLARQQAVLDRMEAAGLPSEPTTTFEAGADGTRIRRELRAVYLLNSVHMEVPGRSINTIRQIPGVHAVYEDRPRKSALLDGSVPYTQAPSVWSAPAPVGTRGAGKVIAVLDSGIDWHHPMFGDGNRTPGSAPLPAGPGDGCNRTPRPAACAGKHAKIVYATAINPPDTLTPTITPLDNVGHGTHVASTAAGSTKAGAVNQPAPGNRTLEGTAPDASIMSWKVLSDAGLSLGQGSIVAMEDAAQATPDHPRADVMNLSIGGLAPNNAVDQPQAVAADNASLLGVTMVIAAGNCGSDGNALCPDGREGPATVSSPGTSRLAISVGAASDPGNDAFVKLVDQPGPPSYPAVIVGVISDENPFGTTIETQYVNCGGAGTPTACGPQATGKIGLIFETQMGVPTLTFEQAKNNAEAGGVIATIFVNHKAAGQTGNEPFDNSLFTAGKPALGITFNTGEAIKAIGFDATQVGRGGKIRMELASGAGFTNSMADFSSMGPLSDYTIKPDVSAPGQNIYAAQSFVCSAPCGTTGYASASGTSMASPHIAGLAALLLAGHPGWGPPEVKAALMNTSALIGASDADPATAEPSVNEQGAGAVRVHDATLTPALLTQPSFSFGEVVTPTGTARASYQKFRLRDVRPSPSGDLIYRLGSAARLRLPNPNFDISFTNVTITQPITSVTVPAGGQTEFMLKVDVLPDLPVSPQQNPSNANDDFLVFEGYEFVITATPSGFSAPGLHAPIFYRHVHVGSILPRQVPRLDDPGESSTTGTYDLHWTSVDDGAAEYQVEETSNLRPLFPLDTAEGNARPSADEMWAQDGGWTASTARNRTPGGRTSYFSGQGSTLNRVLVSKPFSSGQTLRFFEYIDTEPGWDFGTVRAVMADGSKKVLRAESGFNNWRQVTLELPQGTTAVEFAYTSDDNTDVILFEGWYIDDIEIEGADWVKIGSPHETTFSVKDRADGKYYYRVRAMREGPRAASHGTRGPLEPGTASNNVDMVVGRSGSRPQLSATGPPPALLLAGLVLLILGSFLAIRLRTQRA